MYVASFPSQTGTSKFQAKQSQVTKFKKNSCFWNVSRAATPTFKQKLVDSAKVKDWRNSGLPGDIVKHLLIYNYYHVTFLRCATYWRACWSQLQSSSLTEYAYTTITTLLRSLPPAFTCTRVAVQIPVVAAAAATESALWRRIRSLRVCPQIRWHLAHRTWPVLKISAHITMLLVNSVLLCINGFVFTLLIIVLFLCKFANVVVFVSKRCKPLRRLSEPCVHFIRHRISVFSGLT